jgi:hypothetical protein
MEREMMNANKPSCYKCKWRGGLVGDAHSCCKHPKNAAVMNDPLTQIMGIFAGVQRVPPINIETGLHVKGNPYGIKHGWFNWPMNFDPVWLESCDGFEKKEVINDATAKL